MREEKRKRNKNIREREREEETWRIVKRERKSKERAGKRYMGQSKKKNRRKNIERWGGEGKREGNRVQRLKKRERVTEIK